MYSSSNERGFTLPLVILLITLLSVGVALGFARNDSELRTYSDQSASVKAAALAETGLARYLAGLTAVPASGMQDTTITGLYGGYAFVSLRRIRDSAGTTSDVYAVTVTGVATTAPRMGASTPLAQETLTQVVAASVAGSGMNVIAAYTALPGVTHTGGGASIDGRTASGVPAGSGYPNSVPGISMPTGTYTPGTPGITYQGMAAPLFLGTTAAAAAATAIDWPAIVGGGAITPDYTYSSCGSWPSSPAYPIILITGNCNVTTDIDWNGTLIVAGNLTMTGSQQIHGIVLVGGNYNTTGSPQQWGALVSGLNLQNPLLLPQPTAPDQMNGHAQYWYDAREVNTAFQRMNLGAGSAVLVPITNAVAENVPTY